MSTAATIKTKFDNTETLKLVNRARRKDQSAFQELYQRYHNKVEQGIFHIVKDETTAQDIAADTWCKVWQKLPKFQGNSQFFTWLYRVGINEALQHLRKYKNRKFDVSLDEIVEREDTLIHSIEIGRPDARLNGTVGRIDLYRALKDIPAVNKKAVGLGHIFGYSAEEISGVMGCTRAAAKSHIHRGLKRLRDKLDRAVKN